MARVKMQSRGGWSPFNRHDYKRLWFITNFTTSFIDSCLFFCTSLWNDIAHRIKCIHSSFLILIIQQFWVVFSFTYCWVKLIKLCGNFNSTQHYARKKQLRAAVCTTNRCSCIITQIWHKISEECTYCCGCYQKRFDIIWAKFALYLYWKHFGFKSLSNNETPIVFLSVIRESVWP